MDELRAVSLFVRAAEAGSFNRVAESQGVTPQAVSKAIRQLEQALGVRLFHRTTRKTSLTDEGVRLLEQVKPNVEGLAAALASVRGAAREEGGTIRVAASGTVGRKVLVPLMADFQRAHPRVEFDLILEERVTDRVTHRIDVGFRSGAAPDEQVIARRLFPIQQLVCAAPDYWRAHGMPASVEALAHHRCTAYRQPGSGRPVPWEFDVDGVVRFQQMTAGLCSSDTEAEMHAVMAGMGVGQIDSINAAAPLRDGRLVPILTRIVSERMGLYLVYAHRTDMPARVRRFIAFALERLQGSDTFHLPPATLQDLHDRFRATLTSPVRTD
jgi:DNA-binding transcriptional LysR family regulator